MDKVNILGIGISCVNMQEAVEYSRNIIKSDKKCNIFTPNPEILYLSTKNHDLRKALCNACMLLPDGIGVVIAAKILGNPLKGRVTGFDFLHKLCALCVEENKSIFLLGAKEGVAQRAASSLQRLYPGIDICGTHHGYFSDDDIDDVIYKINKSGADVVAVCLGAPKQEIFIHKYRDKIMSSLCIGVGGALDVISGDVRRAPAIWQRMGLEWLYRVIYDPKRLSRLFALPAFVLNVFMQKIGVIKGQRI